MIDNDRKPLVGTSALALGLFLAVTALPTVASVHSKAPHAPAPAAAAQPAVTPLDVTLIRDGVSGSYQSNAKTIAAFLGEHGIVAGGADFVSVPLDAPLAQGARIEYRAAVPVEIIAGSNRHVVLTAARTVGDVLRAQGIGLARGDRVDPAQNSALVPGLAVRIERRLSWVQAIRHRIAAGTVHRYDPSLPQGTSRVAFAGSPGTAEFTYEYVKNGGASTERRMIAKRVLRAPRARVLVHGIGEFSAFAQLAARGFEGTVRLAGNAMRMIATAYTASCSGCSGMTASGARAGYGIVAVDPHLIPLGSRLYIPGYGRAVAGDTGGAIVGHRIDLGFNSTGDALRFGRRPITIYVLR